MTDPNAYYAGGLGVEMYDLFTGGGLLAGDVEFYLHCARRFGGPILELGSRHRAHPDAARRGRT